MRCACLSNVMRNIGYNNIHESNLVKGDIQRKGFNEIHKWRICKDA